MGDLDYNSSTPHGIEKSSYQKGARRPPTDHGMRKMEPMAKVAHEMPMAHMPPKYKIPGPPQTSMPSEEATSTPKAG